MKKTIIFLCACLICNNALANEEYADKDFSFSLYYSNNPSILVTGKGVRTEVYKTGSLIIPDEKNAYIGIKYNVFPYNINNQKHENTKLNIGLLIPIPYKKTEINTYQHVDNGYNGNYGFTADYTSEVSITEYPTLTVDVTQRISKGNDGDIALIGNIGFTAISYKANFTGQQWNYQNDAFYNAYPGEYKSEVTRAHVASQPIQIPETGTVINLDLMGGLSYISVYNLSVNALYGYSFGADKFKGLIGVGYHFW